MSNCGSTSGPGKGSDINGASYGGSGGRDTDDYFSYANDAAQIIGNPLNEYCSESFIILGAKAFCLVQALDVEAEAAFISRRPRLKLQAL